MRILIVTSSYLPVLGGLQNVVHTLARTLMRQGHVVQVMTNRYPRSLPQHEVIEGVSVSRLLFLRPEAHHLFCGRIDLFVASWYFYPKTLFQLTKAIRDFRPDVVNLHFPDCQNVFVLQVHKKIKFKYVVSIHGDEIARFYLAHRKGRDLPILKSVLDGASIITACSDFILKNTLKVFPGFAHKIYTAYNGIESEAFHDKTPYVHVRPYLFAYARFTYNKGLDLLIKAFRRVARSDDHIDLILAGEGEDESKLHRLVNRFKLGERVHFFGRASATQVIQLLNGCEFIVVPSRHETFNLGIIEAFAAGKTAVVTCSGGPAEIVEHGINGFVVEKNNVGALGDAILTLLKDTVLRNVMAQNAVRSQHRFTAARMTERYLHYYQEAVNSSTKENQ